MLRISICVLALTACGGGDDPPAGVDSPSASATVMSTACGSEVATVETTGGFRFAPNAVTISVGENVAFTNSASHSVVPATSGTTDSGLRAGFDTTTCLVFTEAGTFNYKCNPHSSMTGAVTVNP